MAKFCVTVRNVSYVEVEADSLEEAQLLVDQKLDDGNTDTMCTIMENSTGWVIGPVVEADPAVERLKSDPDADWSKLLS